MKDLYSISIVAVVAAVTIALRFLPFWIWRGKRKTPETVIYLGKVLPYAIMGMLVVYCLRSIISEDFESVLRKLFACAVVVVLHLWKRNTLVSIIGGTAVYMILMNFL